MDSSQKNIVFGAEFSAVVEANLSRDPLAVALDRQVPHAAAVASQVKYLQRAREKLIDWYSARCVLPGRAFEQSSGQVAALRKDYSGRVALDLTCGLGVDSWALSGRFERVFAVERDAFLAAVARENFHRLGVSNIEVVCAPAEDFLARTADRFDLVYVDPDRRSDTGRKLVRIQDCSPNVIALLPDIQRVTGRLVVKLSPLFDVSEVVRIFGPGTCVEVVSVTGECKELVADVAFGVDRRTMVRAVAVGLGEMECPFFDNPREPDCQPQSDPFEPDRYKFLVVPDVALQKSRLAVRYFRERGVWIDNNNGYGFAVDRPSDVMGQVLDIQSVTSFDPKALKRRLKADGIRNVDILKHNFPLSTDRLRHALGLQTGKSGSSTLRLAFTSSAGGLWQITLD